jgi:hypothetical protein
MTLASGAILVAGLLILTLMTARHGGDSAETARTIGFLSLALGPLLLFTAARRLVLNTRTQAHAFRLGLRTD